MHFQALSVGIRVPTHHFNGTVHSVFRQACNVRLESHALLTLLPFEKNNVPHGIRLNISSQPAFRDLIRVGQPVACRGGILRIGGPDFSVDLRPALSWHIDLKGLCIDLCRPTQAQSWAVAWSEWQMHCRKHGRSENLGVLFLSEERLSTSAVSEIFLQRSASTIPLLLQATCRLRLREAIISMRSLIGLGYGLTPSGDDFLVGYLTGLWCTVGTDLSRMRFLLALGSELSEASRNTNEISGAYLRSAAKGHVSEPIAKLAQQLSLANSMSSVRAVTQTALQVGHTSGSDGVLGMLLGCLAWQSPALKLICRMTQAQA
ncbi:MAG: hypothetical protein NTAFB01_36290 [Nitrospira sp.]